MNDLIFFAAKVIFGSAFFYGFYKLFMEKETHYELNRFYLLGTVVLSLIIPLFQIPIHSIGQTATFRHLLETIQITDKGEIGESSVSFNTIIIIIVYFSGVLFFLSRFIIGFIQLYLIIKNAKFCTKNGNHFMITYHEVAPFSFWNTIYVNEQLKDSKELETILMHESIHVNQFHSFDVLLYEITSIIFWFNPFFHLLKKSIKEQHEFIVDNIIKKSKTEIKTYLLLLCHTAGIRFNITNNFNKPLIIKRMKKMAQTPSKSITRFKLGLIIPIILGIVIVFSIQNSIAKTIILPVNTNHSIILSSDVVNDTLPKNDKKYREVEIPASFPGGNEKMSIFLGQNIKYPEQCRTKGIEGTVIVEFTVTKEGNLEDIVITKRLDPLLDNEAIRVIKLMPKWIPAEDKGEKVNLIFTLPIRFKLK